jgi:hypothetical protein
MANRPLKAAAGAVGRQNAEAHTVHGRPSLQTLDSTNVGRWAVTKSMAECGGFA